MATCSSSAAALVRFRHDSHEVTQLLDQSFVALAAGDFRRAGDLLDQVPALLDALALAQLDHARELGHTWDDIGRSRSLSRQAAFNRRARLRRRLAPK